MYFQVFLIITIRAICKFRKHTDFLWKNKKTKVTTDQLNNIEFNLLHNRVQYNVFDLKWSILYWIIVNVLILLR